MMSKLAPHWQPIETAPPGDEDMLVYTDIGNIHVAWQLAKQWCNGDVILENMGEIPTHWMPLPAPPTPKDAP